MNDAEVPHTDEEKRLVEETAEATKFVTKPFVEVTLVITPLVTTPFVAKRFVEVAFVVVPLVTTRPSINALEALRLVVVTPPKKVTATEVVAPRAVTMARVSVEYIETQLVPLARQTFWPETRRDVAETEPMLRVAPVALVKVRLAMVPVVTFAVPMVAVPMFEVEALTVEELRTVTIIEAPDALVKARLVVVAFVIPASVAVKVWVKKAVAVAWPRVEETE